MGIAKQFGRFLCLSPGRGPEYTQALFNSLRRCDGIGDYQILANIEEGADEIMALAVAVDFAPINISIRPRAENFSERMFRAVDRAFAKAEFVAYADGDVAVTPDFLRYLEFCAAKYRDDTDVFLIACEAGNPNERKSIAEVARRAVRGGPAIGIWRNRWEWSKRKAKAKAAEYLSTLAKLTKRHHLEEVYPLVSRARRLSKPDDAVYAARSESFREPKPSVTAVMLTGLHRERYSMARIAIECFRAQTYPNRNLLILNHGEESLASKDPRVREVRFVKSRWQTVGDLRNLGLELATGDFIINWDDDDWHHPRRIEVQMEAQGEDTAVLLRRRIHHSLVNGCSRYAEYPRGAEATILHPRRVPFRYPSLLRGSDTVFAQQFPVRLPIENDPAMHIRFFHGLNLWDAGHIMAHLADPNLQGQSEISDEHRALLTHVLPLYGKRLVA